jgi:HEAT repeat protein
MAKARGVEAKLARLRLLHDEAITPGFLDELHQALAVSSNLVVADAATIVGERALPELAQDLEAAFDRLMIEPEEHDKGCRGKIAIIEALNQLEHSQPRVFLAGINHFQEPIWGAPGQDRAGPLRANCAFGLVRLNYPDVLLRLVELLTDSDKVARAGAARALGGTGSLAAIPLLRFKARTGDPEVEVTAECFSALLTLAPAESVPFVAEFLHDRSEPLQEAAALGLGESRRAEAFAALKDFWPQARHGSVQEAVLLGIAMLRLPATVDFLLDVLKDQDQSAARAALSALAIHRHNPGIKERIAAIVTAKGDPSLQQRFEKKFAEKEGN